MKIKFLGAVGTVTGSKFVVSTKNTRIMIDCGLFQGLKELRLKNWKPLPVDIKSIDAVVLTHAHIDHSGYVPALVRDGFTGPVYCSVPTKNLCSILLPDCGRINEEDAEYANRKGFSKHKPAKPIYTEEDATKSLKQFETIPLDKEFKLGELSISMSGAGHILGATSVRVSDGTKSVLFSGDVGRYSDLLENQPTDIPTADWVVMETTYGDRDHSTIDPIQQIADIVQKTSERGGTVLIPSFAVGRTQTLLYCLHQAFEKGYAKKVPVYVNSPMATKVTRLYQAHADWHRLTKDECDETCAIAKFVGTVEESKNLNKKKGPKVIISASGMLTGGRVLHHIKEFGPNSKNTILLPGFQAMGTRGASLANGAKSIKIHGNYVAINAEVIQLDMYSAHADKTELLRWLGANGQQHKKVFLVHGEPEARDNFRRLVEERYQFEVVIPEYNEEFEL